MIFQHTWQQVLDGTKTQTRRIAHPAILPASMITYSSSATGEYCWFAYDASDAIGAVFRKGRLLYKVGNTYSVQPGRGKKAVGRIRITGIRLERVQDITEEAALAEGCLGVPHYQAARDEFIVLWSMIHTKHGERWDDNPLVWVLTFEKVEE